MQYIRNRPDEERCKHDRANAERTAAQALGVREAAQEIPAAHENPAQKATALGVHCDSPVHDREVRTPRAHLLAVLLRHDAGGLRHVPEIVCDPRRKQLT